MKRKKKRGSYLDSVVLEERVIEGWLVRDVHTVYDISIRTLHYLLKLKL